MPLRIISEEVRYTIDYNVDWEAVYFFFRYNMKSNIGGDTHELGEGIGITQPLSTSEINYVLSLRTESWLALKQEQKENVISFIARWWDVVDGYIVEDFDAMLGDLNHQMETYFRNKTDEGVFQTACDIYSIDVSNYTKG